MRTIIPIFFGFLSFNESLAMTKAAEMHNCIERSFLVFDVIHNSEALADEIYSEDIFNFLSVESSDLISAVCTKNAEEETAQNQEKSRVERFLKGMDQQATMVHDSFDVIKEKEKLTKSWVEIALMLYERRDFYGYTSILFGLFAAKEHIGNINLKPMFAVIKNEVYSALKAASLSSGMIPLIFVELMALSKELEQISRSQESLSFLAHRVKDVLTEFTDDIENMQAALKASLNEESHMSGPKRLATIFEIYKKKPMSDQDYADISEMIKDMIYAHGSK